MGALKVQTAPGVWEVVGGAAVGPYVLKAGDTMTGPLAINTTGLPAGLTVSDTVVAAGGVSIGSTGTTLHEDGSATFVETVSINVPSGGGHPLKLNGPAALLSLQNAANTPFIEFFANTGLTVADRYAWIQATATPSLNFNLQAAGGGFNFVQNSVLRMAVTSDRILLFKAATGITTTGFEFDANGIHSGTRSTAGSNVQYNKQGTASAAGQTFVSFKAANTEIGKITEATTTTTGYITTSHGPWKDVVGPTDAAAALAAVRALPVVDFHWKLRPDGTPADDGTPEAATTTGFVAQDLAALAPEAVAQGVGTQADHDAWVTSIETYAAAAQARETDPTVQLPPEPGEDPFSPWGIDNSKLVPKLVAAVQALATFNADLIAALQAVLNPADAADASSLSALLPGA